MGIHQSFFAIERPTPFFEYVQTLQNATSLTTYTFTNANINGPGLIVVGYHQERASTTASTLSSSTIEGSAATSAVTRAQNGSTSVTTGLIYHRIASGSTATIALTFSAAPSRCRIAIWRINDNVSDTPFTTANDGAASGTGLSVTLNSLPVRSVGIAVQTNGTNGTSMTWTNATERYDLLIGTGTTTQASGADFITSQTENRTISTSHSNSAQAIGIAAAAWI
jgi:hypothetical protein